DARTGKGTERLLEAVRAASKSVEGRVPLAQLPGEPVEAYRGLRRLLGENRAAPRAGSRSRAGGPLTEPLDRITLPPILRLPHFLCNSRGTLRCALLGRATLNGCGGRRFFSYREPGIAHPTRRDVYAFSF